MNMHLRLSEDVTIGIEAVNTTITQDVITFTTTEDITLHVTVKDFNVCLSSLVDSFQHTYLIIFTTLLGLTTSNGCNLTTTENTITNDTAPNGDITLIHTTVIVVTSTKDVTTV